MAIAISANRQSIYPVLIGCRQTNHPLVEVTNLKHLPTKISVQNTVSGNAFCSPMPASRLSVPLHVKHFLHYSRPYWALFRLQSKNIWLTMRHLLHAMFSLRFSVGYVWWNGTRRKNHMPNVCFMLHWIMISNYIQSYDFILDSLHR